MSFQYTFPGFRRVPFLCIPGDLLPRLNEFSDPELRIVIALSSLTLPPQCWPRKNGHIDHVLETAIGTPSTQERRAIFCEAFEGLVERQVILPVGDDIYRVSFRPLTENDSFSFEELGDTPTVTVYDLETLDGRRKEYQHLSRAAWRKAVFKRDGYVCRACGTSDQLTVDHIRPLAKDGTNAFDNLQTLCLACNMKKGTRDAV